MLNEWYLLLMWLFFYSVNNNGKWVEMISICLEGICVAVFKAYADRLGISLNAVISFFRFFFLNIATQFSIKRVPLPMTMSMSNGTYFHTRFRFHFSHSNIQSNFISGYLTTDLRVDAAAVTFRIIINLITLQN